METLIIIITTILIGVIIAFIIIKHLFFSSKIDKISTLMDQGYYNEAIKELKVVLNKNDRDAHSHYLLGECYYNQNNYEWAMPEYKSVLKLNDYNQHFSEHQVRAKMAAIYLHYNKLEEAQKEFLLMTKLQPNNFMNYYNIGKIFQDRNFLDNAYTYYKRALHINPQHADSLFKAGEVSYYQKRFGDALVEFQTVLNINRQLIKANYYIGMIHLQSKNFAQAIGEFDKSVLDPEFKLPSLAQKGRALFECGEVDKAIIELERAYRLIKTDDTTALAIKYYLSLCYEETRKLDKAIELWEAISRIRPTYQDVADKLANYSELRVDDKIKDFLIASNTDFLETCKNIVTYLDHEIIDVTAGKENRIDIVASENESKWRNTRKNKRFIRIIRSNDIIGDSVIRDVLEETKLVGGTKAMIIASNKFSRQAVEFAKTRPIDLIDRNGLSKLLNKIEINQKQSQND